MGDELARWAASRAGDLIARAEAEAVAELKAALLLAAAEDAGAAPAARDVAPARTGTLLWTYCVLRAADPAPSGIAGVGGEIERIERAGLAALVSRVPAAEYAEDVLPASLNDLAWLERTARAHEDVLERAGAEATIVPLRICTIFADADGVRRMLDANRAAFETALERLHGRQEWTVKLLVDPTLLEAEPDEPAGGAVTGTAYMLGRRAERERRAAAEQHARRLAEDVHARLQDWAVDAVVNPPQRRELSGYDGEMLLNGAYLVETARADELRELVAELQARHADARLELAGPLPPFNFVPRP